MERIEDRICEAARTLQLLPSPGARFLAQLRSWWPEAPDEWSAYAATDATVPRIIPTAAEIDRMDEVLAWMTALAVERRARQRGGNSRESLRQVYKAGLCLVALRVTA